MGKIRVTEENCLAVANPKVAALWHPAWGMSAGDVSVFIIMHGGNAKTGMSGRLLLKRGQSRTADAVTAPATILQRTRMTL